MEINVKEARAKISRLLKRTEKGEEVVILRRGKKVARLVAIVQKDRQLPDLSKFRASITICGKGLSQAVQDNREEERY